MVSPPLRAGDRASDAANGTSAESTESARSQPPRAPVSAPTSPRTETVSTRPVPPASPVPEAEDPAPSEVLAEAVSEHGPTTVSEGAPDPAPDPDLGPWDRVVEGVRKRKPAIQGFLRGAEAAIDGDDFLRIEIPAGQSIYLDLLQSKDNRRLLAELVQECYGRALGLRFEAATRTAPSPPSASSAQVDDGAAKAGVQRIVDLFDGDVLGPS